jgi:hypothetical protein
MSWCPSPNRSAPKPETFDLTAARLEEFDKAHPWLTTRLFVVVFVLVALWMGSELFSRGGPKAITVGALVGLLFVGFFGLVVCFAMTFMIAFPGGRILEALWKRTQGDSARVRLYERAVSSTRPTARCG